MLALVEVWESETPKSWPLTSKLDAKKSVTSNIIIIYTSKIEYLLVLCVYIDIKMIFSHIIEEKNNIKIEILEEAKFMIEHDFQMMNPGSHVTSCFWWLVQALC